MRRPWLAKTLALVAASGALVGFAAARSADRPALAPQRAPALLANAAVTATAAPDADADLSPAARLALARAAGASPADVAVTAAQAAVRAAPSRDDMWVALGHSWVKKARASGDPGFYLNAGAAVDCVLERNPESALARGVRGLVLLNAHAFEEARALAAGVVAKHPEDALAWGVLSDALLELGRYDEAISAAQTMVDLKPNLPSYSRAAHLQWLRGDVARAKETTRAALDAGRDVKRDPEPGAWMLVQAAMLFWHEGDLDGADAGCDEALRRLPGFAPATVCKGRVALARGEPRRAAEHFARAYVAAPLAETAWLLGDAHMEAGDAARAEEAWAHVEREGRRGDPRTLSLFWSTKGRHTEEAVRLAEAELAIRADVYTEDALAWALHRAGRDADAAKHIARARRLGTPDARLVFHDGAIRMATGDVARGKALVAASLEKNRAFDVASAREAASLLAAGGVRRPPT